ncbi:MAG TPA: hypothetical protein VFV97_06495 [Rhodanobacteraceae bacterium]|nr:hypothetical protein [Rhodanobacteraceae bacterium]
MRLLACIALLLFLAQPCVAQTEDGQNGDGQKIHRCIGEHGEIVFSGIACAGTEVRAAPRTSSLPTPTAPASAVAMACPRSPDELRDVFADALTRRDTNAIASLVRWEGVGGAEARQRLKDIAELGQRPLIGVELDGDITLAKDVPEPSGTLTVRTGSTSYGGPREREFRVGTSGGCYWLDW